MSRADVSNRFIFGAHCSLPLSGVSELAPEYQPSPMTDSGLSSSSTSSSISLGGTALPHLPHTLLSEVQLSAEQDEKVKNLIEFISSRWLF